MGGDCRTHERERKLIRSLIRFIRHQRAVTIQMTLKQIGQECVGRIHVVQEMVQCWELVNVEMNIGRFLVNKINRYTEIQFYWYYYSTCFGQPFCPSSGVLSRTSALVHFMLKLFQHKVYKHRCTAKNS